MPAEKSPSDGTESKTGIPAPDPLTGLFSRGGAIEELARIAEHRELSSLSVVTVEISRFGSINDSIGASLGDKIIAMTAKRLLKTFPDALMTGRMHGDHFCMAFDESVDLDGAIKKLLDFTQRPLVVRGEIIVLSIRVGVADPSCHAESASDLLHAAEVALHRAKLQLAKISYFNAAMIDDARAAHRLENDLRVSLVTKAAALHSAIANDEFFLCYQPIISILTRRVHGFEALLRWNHPQLGVVSPAQFIPIAEEIRVMDVLGAWVLRRACADATTWQAVDGGPAPSVSVNVSPTQLEESRLFEHALDQALIESGLAPNRLKLEVTEAVASDVHIAEQLHILRKRGCQIALDDFGTGYSSLTQILTLPLDYIKIDQSFMRGSEQRDEEKADQFKLLTRSILACATALNMTSIVEGVESAQQVESIREWGGDLIQGYFYSKPMAADAIADYLAEVSI
jgi:diguanylate cyclase (GGDEF)-like protein